MERIFGASDQDQHLNQLLQQIKSCLVENEAVIERVLIHFVFNGDPAEAERSQVLDKLREDLENKKYLIDQRFGRPVRRRSHSIERLSCSKSNEPRFGPIRGAKCISALSAFLRLSDESI
jgi:hypothetical protein